MKRRVLKNKPLIEAIFELRWELRVESEGVEIDPHYKITIGRIYDRIREEYPFHEQLATATMPDEIAAHVIQHRFRRDKETWPLVQVGPGIVTLNDTEGYVWEDFEKRAIRLLDALFEAYPEAESNLNPNGLLLRFINAVDFDYGTNDIFAFLKDQMKINIEIYQGLFGETCVADSPLGLDLRFSFLATRPKGAAHLRLARGKRRDADALIWETHVQSVGEDAPKTKDQISVWIADAHTLTEDWFFKMTEGELLRGFE